MHAVKADIAAPEKILPLSDSNEHHRLTAYNYSDISYEMDPHSPLTSIFTFGRLDSAKYLVTLNLRP